MMKPGWIFPAALFLFAVFAWPAQAEPMVLQGEVQRGETIVHPFEYGGQSFVFRLVPVGHGWRIWVGDRMNRQRNYVAVVTPPYRGINPAVIQGWHFRNADNSGPNKPGEGNVNAPQEIREFLFVLDTVGYQAAYEALEILMWPEGRGEADIVAAEQRLETIPKAQATLEIIALELGNLVTGEQAWIERLAFRVSIELP
jgi:hypothetical protein